MKILCDRLLALLEPHDFRLGRKVRGTNPISFVRVSRTNDLFESIVVDCQGRNEEAVYAYLGVSVTSTPMFKLLGAMKLLEEVATDAGHRWTKINDEAAAVNWELMLAAVAPGAASEWAAQRGPVLLKDTKEARQATKGYLAYLPEGDAEGSVAQLRAEVPTAIADAAQGLLKGPGGYGAAETEIAYELAYLLLLRYSNAVEGGRSYYGLKPNHDKAMMMRVHILADRILLSWCPGPPRLNNRTSEQEHHLE